MLKHYIPNTFKMSVFRGDLVQIRTFSLKSALVLLTCLLSACNTYDYHEATSGEYDREKLCTSLHRQLQYFDNPNYRRRHPISDEKLDALGDQYIAHGCEK